MSDDTLGAALASAIERLRVLLLDSNDGEHAVWMRKLFIVNLIETMERARYAMAAQDAPPARVYGDNHTEMGMEFEPEPIAKTFRPPIGMFMLHTHEQIRAKYFDRINPPTAFERLLFDTAVDNPSQGEALRAFFEGRA